MSAIKLVVSDMDNTLLGNDNRISPANQEAILALKEAGIHFVLATGRTHLTVQAFAYQLGNNEPVITCNGAMISRLLTGDLLFERHIPEHSLRHILDFLLKYDCRYLIYTLTSVYSSFQNRRLAFFQDYNRLAEAQGQSPVSVKALPVDQVREYLLSGAPLLDNPALKIFVFSEDQGFMQLLRQQVTADEFLSCAQSMTGNLDIMPSGVSKGDAVLYLANHYDLNRSQIAAFGDQENDIPMLQQAGLAVVMDNARPMVKSSADVLAPDHDESGFAQIVWQYIL